MFLKPKLLQSSYFGVGGGGSPVSSATDNKPTVPTLYSATIALADTEQSYSLPAGTRWFSLINHDIRDLKIAYTLGQSGTNYRIVPRGCSSVHPEIDSTASITIYFQAAAAGGRLEIESWA